MEEAFHDRVLAWLHELQAELCGDFASVSSERQFHRDAWRRDDRGQLAGQGVTAVLEGDSVFERGGVALSDVRGIELPPAATARNPKLAGAPWRATGVSVVMHPHNPHAPTSHMNVRCFRAGGEWWFGGGFDLTPYIPYEADVRAWHGAAAAACNPFHPELYPALRRQCDEYFFLKHRQEARGIGGIFYDDLNAATPQFGLSAERCFEFMRAVGTNFRTAYAALVRARHATPFSAAERRFQLQRRGRYVEFNLVQDRGTLFGLQSGGRTEAILVSMPPLVQWAYGSLEPELEARLLPYLTSRRGEQWV